MLVFRNHFSMHASGVLTAFHQKSRDAALAKVHEILSGYNRELWSVRGIHMSLRQELAQMPGGNQPQAVFQPFVRSVFLLGLLFLWVLREVY